MPFISGIPSSAKARNSSDKGHGDFSPRPGNSGVKRNPPLLMRPGDVAEVEISGIGVLRSPIIAEAG
jgi:2-keto-4-pentenoate hydratase/2-oxohepta-3-ene-1,7-dioic acid hydratase in catechol pathway